MPRAKRIPQGKSKITPEIMRSVGPWIKDKIEIWPKTLSENTFEEGIRTGAMLAIRDLMSGKLTVPGLLVLTKKE